MHTYLKLLRVDEKEMKIERECKRERESAEREREREKERVVLSVLISPGMLPERSFLLDAETVTTHFNRPWNPGRRSKFTAHF